MAWFHGASYTWKYIWVLYLNFSLVLHDVPPGKETTLDSERGLRCLSVRHGSQAKLIKAAQHQGLPSTMGCDIMTSSYKSILYFEHSLPPFFLLYLLSLAAVLLKQTFASHLRVIWSS